MPFQLNDSTPSTLAQQFDASAAATVINDSTPTPVAFAFAAPAAPWAANTWCWLGALSMVMVAQEPLIHLVESPNIPASGANTTAQLIPPTGKTTGDFIAGRIQDDENPADAIAYTVGKYSELEWSFIVKSGVPDDTVFEFRITRDGGEVLDVYSVNPRLTVGGGLTPLTRIASIPVEHAAGVSITRMLPVDILQRLAREVGRVPIENLQHVADALGIPVESLQAVERNSGVPIENLQHVATALGVPIEILQQVARAIGVPIDDTLTFGPGYVIPLAILQSLTSYLTIPVEHRASISVENVLPLDMLRTLASSLEIPAEWTAAVETTLTRTVSIPVDSTQGIASERSAPSEWTAPLLVGLARDVDIPVEWLQPVPFPQFIFLPTYGGGGPVTWEIEPLRRDDATKPRKRKKLRVHSTAVARRIHVIAPVAQHRHDRRRQPVQRIDRVPSTNMLEAARLHSIREADDELLLLGLL